MGVESGSAGGCVSASFSVAGGVAGGTFEEGGAFCRGFSCEREGAGGLDMGEGCAGASVSSSKEMCIRDSVVSYATLEKVLRSLLKEGVPIKDLGTILETLVDALGQGRDVDAAIEQVRGALARTITRRFCEDGQLRVVTLDAEVEKKIISSLTRNEQGVYLAMGPDLMQQIVTQMAEYIRKFNELSQTPVILVSQVIRGYFSKMITQFYPSVYVLSFNEVTSSVQIQAIGNIAMDTASRKAVAR